jgi:hypothetical protein
MTKTAGVVTTHVKCPVTLDREGVEFPYWEHGICGSLWTQKRCKETLSTPMPETEENAAALLMLIESVPKVWGSKLASMKIASAAYQWVRQKFTEGADLEVTSRWLELLHQRMTETETLEEYYNRMVALCEALKGNGHPIMERDVKLAIIKGLPEAAKEAGMIPSSAGRDLEGLWEIIATTAKGLGCQRPEYPGSPLWPEQPSRQLIPPHQGLQAHRRPKLEARGAKRHRPRWSVRLWAFGITWKPGRQVV